jgi:hypothetical protein
VYFASTSTSMFTAAPTASSPKVVWLQGGRDEADLDPGRRLAGFGHRGQSQGHSVEGDGPLDRGQRGEIGGDRDAQRRPVCAVDAVDEFAAPVDVALNDVAVEAPRGGRAALEVDPISRGQGAESRQAQSLAHHLGGEVTGLRREWLLPCRGQADTVDGEGSAEVEVGDEFARVDGDRGRIVRVYSMASTVPSPSMIPVNMCLRGAASAECVAGESWLVSRRC